MEAELSDEEGAAGEDEDLDGTDGVLVGATCHAPVVAATSRECGYPQKLQLVCHGVLESWEGAEG